MPLEYLDAKMELGSLKALQESINEERVRFEAKKGRIRSLHALQRVRFVEPPQSIRKEKDLDSPCKPLALQEVLNSNIRILLSTFLVCIPNLGIDLATGLEGERPFPQDEVEYDFIDEGVDQ